MSEYKFTSKYKKLSDEELIFPPFKGRKCNMRPIDLHDISARLPAFLEVYKPLIEAVIKLSPFNYGVGYLTIDETNITPGDQHRRGPVHVDGVYMDEEIPHYIKSPDENEKIFEAGFVTVSTVAGCRIYPQEFKGKPTIDGSCVHLQDQLNQEKSVLLEANKLYWLHGLAVHESITMFAPTQRQFFRLSFHPDAKYVASVQN